MSDKTLGVPPIDFGANDQTKFARLVAAILTASVLEPDSPSPDQVFKVYGNIVRIIENQPSGFWPTQ
jgi:hypothetical protein